MSGDVFLTEITSRANNNKRGRVICCVTAESQQLDSAPTVSRVSRCTGKQTTTTTIIHLWEVIVIKKISRPHKRNNYSYYVCSRQRPLRVWKMCYMCGFITLNAADFYYVCNLSCLRTLLLLAAITALLHAHCLRVQAEARGHDNLCQRTTRVALVPTKH